MQRPEPYGVKILADFMASQPIRENLPGGIMIRQIQFLGGKLMALLIFCGKIAPYCPDSSSFPFQDK
jgi:hypothetical protein